MSATEQNEYPTHITGDDLMMLLRNYCRLEQAAARMFRRWAEMTPATETTDRQTLFEFADIEQEQASAIARHLHELGGTMTDGPVPLEDAINKYIEQIDSLPTLAERLRFNYTVMSVLERPIVMRVLLEHTSPATQALFEGILENEDRILGWCDRRSAELGVTEVDIDRYFAGIIAEA